MNTHTITNPVPGVAIPDRHRVTTINGANGTYWLYGYHAFDTTARFALIYFAVHGAHAIVLNGDTWPTAHKALAAIAPKVPYVSETLRSVLPDHHSEI